MMLVCMDLARGSVVAEAVAADRREAPWDAVGKARLATLGVGVRSRVSDRAKALIQLAATGLACLRAPDVFHLRQDLTKGSALAMCSRLRHAQEPLPHAQERLAACQAAHPDGAEVHHAPAVVQARDAAVQRWQNVRSDYRHHLEQLSLIMHPWRLVGAIPQTAHEGEAQLPAEVAALETLVATPGVPIKKHALDTVRQPRAGGAALVGVWWQAVWHDVPSQVALPPRGRGWVAEGVRPLMSWQEHLARTRCPRRKAKL